MLALNEFANFVNLNMANLATTYARLLAERGGEYESIHVNSRLASARRLLKAVTDSCKSGSSDPLYRLFVESANSSARWPHNIEPLQQPWLELECLGQTLTPVVSSLDAGKFLWQILSEVRTTVVQHTLASMSLTYPFLGIQEDITERKQAESRLAKRADKLQTVAEVSMATSSILETDRLLQEVVDLAKGSFDLYHAHIYLLNDARDTLYLAAGAGTIGRRMVSEGWSIPLEQEHSLVARAARGRAGVIANNVREEPDFLPNRLLPDTRSEMAIPMIAVDRVLGVLDVQADVIDHFSNEDVHIQSTLAAQVANAINNARLFENVVRAQEEAETRLRELQTLQQLSHALSGTLQVDEIIDSFFQGCTKLLGFDFVILSLIDKNHQRIRAIAGLNVTDAHIERANHPLDSDNIMADIIRTGHTEIISGWDERFDMDNFDAEGMANWGMRVLTPITLQQENIGVVEVGFNNEVEVTVQDSQIRLVRILIDQTALALDNAQRYQASQRTAHREQTIREITENMQAAPNLEVLVKTTAEELGSRLSAAHVVVELGLESSLEEDIVNQPPQNGANA